MPVIALCPPRNSAGAMTHPRFARPLSQVLICCLLGIGMASSALNAYRVHRATPELRRVMQRAALAYIEQRHRRLGEPTPKNDAKSVALRVALEAQPPPGSAADAIGNTARAKLVVQSWDSVAEALSALPCLASTVVSTTKGNVPAWAYTVRDHEPEGFVNSVLGSTPSQLRGLWT